MTLPIRRVVVHPDGARVHREGPVPVADGRLVVGGLPWLLDPTSVRVEGAGLGEVEVDLDPDSLRPPDRPASLEALSAAQLKTRRLAAELEGLRTERAWTSRLYPSFTDEPERQRPTAQALAGWIRLDRVVDEQLRALDDRIDVVAREHQLAAEAAAALASRVAGESGEPAWRWLLPARRVRARTDGPGPVHVTLSYVVPGAGWSPSYVLDADAALARGRFALRALVVQATGEDWTDVALSLATAPVARRVDLPALRSLRLSSRQERPPAAFRELPADLDSLFPEDLPASEARPAPPPPPSPTTEAWNAPEAPLAHPVLAEQESFAEEAVRAAPMTLAPQAARSKAASPLGAVSGLVGGALDAVFGGGGAPSASMAPGAPPARMRREVAAMRAADDAPADVDANLVVDELDHGRFRLAAADEGAGRRGRLLPASEAERVRELGGDPARFATQTRTLQQRCEAVARTPWPAHHVAAAPIAGSDRVFPVDGRVDLAADGHPHSLAVTAWSATLGVSYRAVPRVDPRAFRLVDVRLDDAQGSLLPGPVDVLVGGRLEVTTPWAGSAGRGQLRIGLGAEDRLKVVRNVRHKDESAGLFGGSRRVVTHVEVQVASSMPVPVRLELLDRVPVPADRETLTVELTESSPVAEVWKGEPDRPPAKGARLQRVEVPAGGEARAVLSWAVTLGAKDELVGGDHRG